MVAFVVFSALLAIWGIQDSLAQDGPEGCITASCGTFNQINTLYCHTNPARFCQCRPTIGNVWTPQVMPCPEPETVFSFRHQVCVRPDLRDEAECDQSGGPDDNTGDDDDDDGENGGALCQGVPCVTYREINTLSCHPNMKKFCQCKPLPSILMDPTTHRFAAVVMPCAKDTSFSFRHQTCARDQLWFNTCPM